MLRGLTTMRYQADDHAAAKRWYAELLGIEPYFDRPGYAEFRVGDYQHELGLLDSAFASQLAGGDTEAEEPSGAEGAEPSGGEAAEPSGVVVYWHVDDVPATIARLIAMGANEHEPPRDFGGFIAASVVDPFGNILGVMYNPHYLEVLSTRSSANQADGG
jgi:catechol 2,3-dioxygenase-like lactoylglutathione lyase family enzyme